MTFCPPLLSSTFLLTWPILDLKLQFPLQLHDYCPFLFPVFTYATPSQLFCHPTRLLVDQTVRQSHLSTRHVYDCFQQCPAIANTINDAPGAVF